MKKLLCILAVVAVLTVCGSCSAEAETAKKINDIPDITKGYFEGNEDASKLTLNLDDYVDANGASIAYYADSDNTEVATVDIDESVLTATMYTGEGQATISVDVVSDGKKAFELSFTITATVYERIACIGDSLTYGHSWHGESYPVYLQEILGEGIEVRNFGVNGSAVTNRSESNYKLKYDTLQEYSDSIAFAPDIVVIMLGTNDGYNWAGSAPTFEEEYAKLINSYLENGADSVVLLTSPPTLEGNFFNLPNDIIKEEICTRQRTMAEQLSLPLVDVREAFEAHTDMTSLFRLPASSDGVHLSVEGAKLVANLVAATLIKL